MKLRDAVAVALTGWYLLTPPMNANRHYNRSAPLPDWHIEAGFPSGEDCRKTLAVLASRARAERSTADVEKVKEARCVSSDDPALKGN
jgi:hypothetical protein